MPFIPPPVEIEGGIRFKDKLVDNLIELCENEENCDFTLVLENGSEIHCHKAVIVSQSMFVRKLVEIMDPPKNRVRLDNFPTEIMEKLLSYMYMGNVHIPRDETQDIVVAADYLQLDKLIDVVANYLDAFLKTETFVSWRDTAERIDDPRMAMYIKKMMVKHYRSFRKTEQIMQLDAVEIGKYMVEFNMERISKDHLVSTVLRWMRYDSNTDALDWLTPEQFDEFIALFVAQWKLAHDEDTPVALKVRTYHTLSCLKGPVIDTEMKKYQKKTNDPFRKQMAKRRAEKIANKRAPRHLSNPPRDTKYTLSNCFNVFKKAVKEICEKKGDVIDERMIEEKYDILMGNRKFRMALGPKVLEVIQMKNCTMRYLNKLLSPNLPDDVSRLVRKSPAVTKCAQEARSYIEKRKARVENWNQKSPLRLASIGGSINGEQNDRCYMAFNWEHFDVFMSLPNEFNMVTSCHCEIPKGFMSTGKSACMLYDKLDGVYDLVVPCPVQRRRFAMTHHQGRVYTISGLTGEWHWKSTAQYLDLEKGEWHKLPDGPVDYMTDPSAVGIGKFIYVFSKAEHLCRLDTETHEWKTLTKMPVQMMAASCCTDGKRLWVAGGLSSLCYVYDPETDEWEQKASPLFQHDYPGLCFHMGLMFLMGGKDCCFVEEYDPETNEWIESPISLQDPIERCTAIQIPVKGPKIVTDAYPLVRGGSQPMEFLDVTDE